MSNIPVAGNLTPKEWEEKHWKKNNIGWHMAKPHKYLVQFYDLLCKNEHSKVFVPLCGKTVDIIWLADKGHEVFGLEFSEIGILDFFKENELPFTQSKFGPFVEYKAESKKITIYQGDFFDANKEFCGKFDCIWDRGAFEAIDVDMRKRYSEIINELLNEKGIILLTSFLYDTCKFPGPPHNVSENDLCDNFGSFCTIKPLLKEPFVPNPFGLEELLDVTHLLIKN